MRKQGGFTYLAVLLAIALLGIGLVAASEVWVTTARRQRAVQLEWVGQQYVQAIGSYYDATPGPVKALPRSLQDLLEDHRMAFTRRHLRSLYVNPVSGDAEWELLRAPDGGIRGVRAVADSPERGAAVASREYQYVPVVR